MVNIMNSKPTSSTDQSAIALVTGASSGIGRACAEQLQQLGFRVYGASRRINEAAPAGIVCLPMNVDDEDSVNNGVAQLLAAEQRLDVLVNCAGYGIGGAIEDTTIDEAKAQFETNFFGLLRVCRAVLPAMRHQGEGLIINVGSIAGRMGLPFRGIYSASKAAVAQAQARAPAHAHAPAPTRAQTQGQRSNPTTEPNVITEMHPRGCGLRHK